METQTKPEYEKIAEIVYKKLSSPAYKVGDRFISERELAEKLGYSRVTVRNAFDKLEREGLIIRVPRKGTFVLNKSEQLTSKSKSDFFSVGLLLFNVVKANHYGWFMKGFAEASVNQPISLLTYYLSSNEIRNGHSVPEMLIKCDGYIIVGDYTENDIAYFLRMGKPVVVVGMAEDEILRNVADSYVQISWDHRMCYSRAVEFLWKRGYRKPILIVGSLHSAYRERIAGFKEGLRYLNQDPDKFGVVIFHPSDMKGTHLPEEDEKKMEQILESKEKFDSIITCVKEELIGAVVRRGLSIFDTSGLLLETGYPDEFALTCGISEMRLDHTIAGKIAAEKILQQFNEGRRFAERLTIPMQIIIRDSCPPKENR